MIPDLKLKMETRRIGKAKHRLKKKYLTKGYYDKNIKPTRDILIIPPSEKVVDEIAKALIQNLLNEQ